MKAVYSVEQTRLGETRVNNHRHVAVRWKHCRDLTTYHYVTIRSPENIENYERFNKKTTC
jgi:hypothetical protein